MMFFLLLFSYNNQPETEEMVVDSLSAGLKRILHTIMENGQIYDYPSNEVCSCVCYNIAIN